MWKIWCDGACSGNPGPCGWGSVVENPDGVRSEHSGFIQQTGTNNIAELTAAIESLKLTPVGAHVHLCSDSQYVLKGLKEWLPVWMKKGWRTSTGKPVLNKELWQQLNALDQDRRVVVEWVRGHNGHTENEIADQLAVQAVEMAL